MLNCGTEELASKKKRAALSLLTAERTYSKCEGNRRTNWVKHTDWWWHMLDSLRKTLVPHAELPPGKRELTWKLGSIPASAIVHCKNWGLLEGAGGEEHTCPMGRREIEAVTNTLQFHRRWQLVAIKRVFYARDNPRKQVLGNFARIERLIQTRWKYGETFW